MNNDKTITTKDKTVKNKILLIDDEIDACLTFKNMLEENGFDTNTISL
jgi:PleD family two-component response regulator